MSKYIKLYDAIMAMDEWFSEPITPTQILSDLPTIEVSEDCISRAWVQNKLTEYVKDYTLNELDSWQNTIVEWIATDIEDAPSVVPAYQPITIKTDEKDSKSLKEQLKDIKTPGILMTEEEYGLFGCRVRTVEHAPSVVPSRADGEWQITDAYPHNVYCSECHKKFAQTHWAVWEDGSLPRNYCPNCGAKMKG